VVHALLILAAVVSLAPLLAHLPMASLAALLLVVAWNMSEARHFVHILKVAPREDILVLLACFGLTVIFDMVIAVGVGVVLAAFLFMRRMAEITNARKLEADHPRLDVTLPESVQVYEIAGPMFFGAAEKAISSLEHIGKHVDIVVLDLGGVPVMDVTGLVALDSILGKLHARDICVVLAGVQKQPARLMRRAGIRDIEGKMAICGTLDDAVQRIDERLRAAG
jgi:SulP family sulfate permease